MGVAEGIAPMVIEVEERKAIFPLPSQPGHYSIRYDQTDSTGAILDVNPSPLESELVFETATTVLENWQRNSDDDSRETRTADNEPSNRPTAISLSKMEAMQQLNWWYILTAAMAFLMVETIWGVQQQK
jgi:hypothetical protein